MNKKKNAEIKDFRGWMHWAGSGEGGAMEWMNQNKASWMLLWFTFAYGDEKALKLYEIYSNAPNKSEHFDRAFNDYGRVVDRMDELLRKEEAKYGKNTGRKRKQTDELLRKKRQGGGNGGRAIEC